MTEEAVVSSRRHPASLHANVLRAGRTHRTVSIGAAILSFDGCLHNLVLVRQRRCTHQLTVARRHREEPVHPFGPCNSILRQRLTLRSLPHVQQVSAASTIACFREHAYETPRSHRTLPVTFLLHVRDMKLALARLDKGTSCFCCLHQLCMHAYAIGTLPFASTVPSQSACSLAQVIDDSSTHSTATQHPRRRCRCWQR